jgi:hypothetical protein
MKQNIERKSIVPAAEAQVTEVGGVPINELRDSLLADIIRAKADASQSTLIAAVEQVRLRASVLEGRMNDGRKLGNETQHQRSIENKAFAREENKKLIANPQLLRERQHLVGFVGVRAEWVLDQMGRNKKLQINGKPYSLETVKRWLQNQG